MVVDTVSQGQASINFLRSQNVGRTSFMVLKELSTNRFRGRVQTPEKRRSACSTSSNPDSKFAPVFYKAVGNTRTADDLEQADRIAFGGTKGWRVVTLAGQLIN
ncbi:SMCs flexible hinge [Melanogaster broomeanus]|nr:SMCs flexible hinge [Melanogaster broomeanus]